MPSAGFWASDACLLATQATVVALPRPRAPSALDRLASPWWALLPLASIVGVVAAIRASGGTADLLTWLALLAVPPLAATSLGWTMRGGRPAFALLAVGLFALAWADRGGLPGEGAAVALSALSCVTLGVLLAALAPPDLLKVGIVLMATADAILVGAELLQPANDVLNAAAPAAHLPRLQRALLGDAVMGYGDLFVAGLLGALVAAQARSWHDQGRAALLVLALAAAFDALFLVLDVLPATVPVALALAVLEASRRRAPRGR